VQYLWVLAHGRAGAQVTLGEKVPVLGQAGDQTTGLSGAPSSRK
jgi:hypothetical protein